MKLAVLKEGDPGLRLASTPVETLTRKTVKLIDDMLETMYAAKGIGLAAPQVGVHKRIIVIDLQTRGSKPVTLVNPVIIRSAGERDSEEGCLSCPGLSGIVKRAAEVRLEGLDQKGRRIEIDAQELLACAFQHEIDHLDGILFIDRLDPTERIKVEQQRKASMM